MSKDNSRKKFIFENPIFQKVPARYGPLKRKADKIFRLLETWEKDETLKPAVRNAISLLKGNIFPRLSFIALLKEKFPRKGPAIDRAHVKRHLTYYYIATKAGKKALQEFIKEKERITLGMKAVEARFKIGKEYAEDAEGLA